MARDARKLDFALTLTAGRAGFARTLQVCLLVVFGCLWTHPASGTELRKVPAVAVISGAQIAVADFDGDQNPDFARVEGGRIGSASTDYWILLDLTASGRQAIHFVAPSGGLLIEARDVNGDHAVDIVLSTAWLRQPVAVFLNDGHGRFSRAEPSAFPGAFTGPPSHWGSSSSQRSESAGIPPETRSGIASGGARLADDRGSGEPVRSPRPGFLLNTFLIASPGRAPPSEGSSL